MLPKSGTRFWGNGMHQTKEWMQFMGRVKRV